MNIEFARELRKTATKAEILLWTFLRRRQLQNYRFRRQRPIGSYIVDFICLEKKLIVEVDGGQHAVQEKYDAQRSLWLRAHGFRTIRFWNNEGLSNTDVVLDVILRELEKDN